MVEIQHPRVTALGLLFGSLAAGSLLTGEPGLVLILLSVSGMIAYLMYRSEKRLRAGP
jgi:hypothetical protein